jgi:DNA topoisomerase IA
VGVIEIVVATDAGREGELIFRLIYEASQSSVPFKRLWVSSQTDEALLQGCIQRLCVFLISCSFFICAAFAS